MVSKKIKKMRSQILGFLIFLQHFVHESDGNHKEEKRNGYQDLHEDQEDALSSLRFVIFLQSFVKGTDGNFRRKVEMVSKKIKKMRSQVLDL